MTTPPPRHPFEVRITIGGDDWDYITRTMAELVEHLKDHGSNCSLASGGAGGSHSVNVEKRDITPEQYHSELASWHQQELKRRDDEKSKESEGKEGPSS